MAEQHLVLSITDAIAEETGYTEICVREVLEASELVPAVRSLVLQEIADLLEEKAMRDAAEIVRALKDPARCQSQDQEGRERREYMSGGDPGGTCACGRTPDPGIRPEGGCWCTEEERSALQDSGGRDEMKLRRSQVDALRVVGRLESECDRGLGSPPASVARALGRNRGSVEESLAKLEESGYVRAIFYPLLSAVYALTDQGRAALEALQALRDSNAEHLSLEGAAGESRKPSGGSED